MLFSQRVGIVPVPSELKTEEISPELRNLLWTAFHINIIDGSLSRKSQDFVQASHLDKLAQSFVIDSSIHFFKIPFDTIPKAQNQFNVKGFCSNLRNWFFKGAHWFNIFDFIEFCLCSEFLLAESVDKFIAFCNVYFEREFSGYRIVNREIVRITGKEEIKAIESAIGLNEKFAPVRTHFQTALKHISDRKTPDYRNSIKESISAVESLCKIITGDKKSTLGDALKKIEKAYPLHTSLKDAFLKLYGYTNDSGGIRHALLEDAKELKLEDAKFVLVTCSAFVNYLIVKTS